MQYSPAQKFLIELLIGLALIAILAGIGALILGRLDTSLHNPVAILNPQLVTNVPAPDFELPDKSGKNHSLGKSKGKPILLNFWSMDCPPCVKEMPSLERLANTARRQGTFSVLTVTIDKEWSDVSHIFSKNSNLKVLFDPNRSVVEKLYGSTKFPETFLIDSQGHIRARFDGPRDWSRPEVVELLKNY